MKRELGIARCGFFVVYVPSIQIVKNVMQRIVSEGNFTKRESLCFDCFCKKIWSRYTVRLR